MSLTKPIQFWVSEELHNDIKDYTERRGMTISALARILVQKQIYGEAGHGYTVLPDPLVQRKDAE